MTSSARAYDRTGVSEPAFAHARAAALVAAQLGPVSAPADAVLVATIPAPVAPLDTLLLALPAGDGFLWDPPAGPGVCGVGATVTLTASGRDRYRDLTGLAQSLWRRITIGHARTGTPPAVRLYGGFAFAPGSADSEPWNGFGDARFVLPRWRYFRDGARAWLSVALGPADDATIGGGWACELETILGSLSSPKPAHAAPRATAVAVDESGSDRWVEQVDSIRRAIVGQRCEKIVAARCTTAELAQPLAPTEVLQRLGERYADCYRFALLSGASSFIGATPERLIQRDGDTVVTEALAGSIKVEAADQLLASGKDRREQQLVVNAIENVLAPLCDRLEVPDEPGLRTLRHVVHLETRIRGRLAAPVHVIDLVAALHPTPAVGGVPTAAAMAWIAEHEAEPRGWYAAPIGWFDAAGDGEFAVAIRSGLLRHRRAYLYAGAGIVRDSNPDAELAETRLKQRALLDALGGAA